MVSEVATAARSSERGIYFASPPVGAVAAKSKGSLRFPAKRNKFRAPFGCGFAALSLGGKHLMNDE